MTSHAFPVVLAATLGVIVLAFQDGWLDGPFGYDGPAAVEGTAFVPASLTVHRGDTVIVYCHIGQQGTAILFAARSIGLRAVLYDGSFEDRLAWDRAGQPRMVRAIPLPVRR